MNKFISLRVRQQFEFLHLLLVFFVFSIYLTLQLQNESPGLLQEKYSPLVLINLTNNSWTKKADTIIGFHEFFLQIKNLGSFFKVVLNDKLWLSDLFILMDKAYQIQRAIENYNTVFSYFLIVFRNLISSWKPCFLILLQKHFAILEACLSLKFA